MSENRRGKSITLRPSSWGRMLIEWHMTKYGEPTMSKTIFRALEELQNIKKAMRKARKEDKKVVVVKEDILEAFVW